MSPTAPVTDVDPDSLADWLVDGSEVAVLDAREQGVFLNGHLFHAACVPLSHLELTLPTVVPRRSTRLVWCDDGGDDDLAGRAADRSASLGWTNGHVLTGGVAAWAASGREVYRGVNVPSKAFGEHVEHTYGTPRLPAAEVKQMIDDGVDLVVLDSRPMEEFRRMSIPTGTDCPGAELVHRVKEVVTDPSTLVIVNCAGRTRSIIGCQSLVNAGLENRVVALENGTMGWELAGYEVARGHDAHAPDPGPDARTWSEAAAIAVGERFGVVHADRAAVDDWLSDADRTTYLLDVRTPDEFITGHLPGSRSAPGGQLVQATDEYVATRNARLVLIDDNGVRATMTASWLRQMGWHDAVVYDAALDVDGLDTGPAPHPSGSPAPTIRVSELADRLGERGLAVLDIGTSLKYRDKGHVTGAWWGVRSRLVAARGVIGDVETLVVTSSDGRLAKLAVDECAELWPAATIVALAGGNKSWRHAGHEMEPGFTRPTTDQNDVWYKPYDHVGEVVATHMQDYLTWEIALVEQLERDPTVTFPSWPDALPGGDDSPMVSVAAVQGTVVSMTDDAAHDTEAAVRLVVPASLDQIADVRRRLTSAILAAGDSRSVADDIALAASELSTNVIQYAATDNFTVSCVRREATWVLAVSHAHGVGLETRADGTPSPDGGRGLMIVRALMDTVELVERGDEISVRCTLASR